MPRIEFPGPMATSTSTTTRAPGAGRAAAKKKPAAAGAKPAGRPRGRPAAADAIQYRNGSLRDELIHSGKAMLEQVSLADLSLRGIAASVGVSQVAPEHHFGNKEGLL